ncbi:hypothetical protein F5884DRAFT_744322 [Xylogone sp. PMI_703]|nr:hypothetical protein F5884DRAFT_744322 [Xylogone sp. PMI_703]
MCTVVACHLLLSLSVCVSLSVSAQKIAAFLILFYPSLEETEETNILFLFLFLFGFSETARFTTEELISGIFEISVRRERRHPRSRLLHVHQQNGVGPPSTGSDGFDSSEARRKAGCWMLAGCS